LGGHGQENLFYELVFGAGWGVRQVRLPRYSGERKTLQLSNRGWRDGCREKKNLAPGHSADARCLANYSENGRSGRGGGGLVKRSAFQ
jgi:hypothetical protein